MIWAIAISLVMALASFREKDRLELSLADAIVFGAMWPGVLLIGTVMSSGSSKLGNLDAPTLLSMLMVVFFVGTAGRPGIAADYAIVHAVEESEFTINKTADAQSRTVWFVIALLLAWFLGLDLGGHY